MLLVELPIFMSSGLGFNIKEVRNMCCMYQLMVDLMNQFCFSFQNALLSAIPFVANWIYTLFYGRFLDALVHRPNTSFKTVHARKLSMAIGRYPMYKIGLPIPNSGIEVWKIPVF